jgi:acyl carrier protein
MTDSVTTHLQKCFSAVFPDASPEQIAAAAIGTLEGWDSMATVTLVTVIGEEFGTELDLDDIEQFQSFQSLATYLRGRHNA